MAEGDLSERANAVYECMMILDQAGAMSIGEMMDAMRDIAPELKSTPINHEQKVLLFGRAYVAACKEIGASPQTAMPLLRRIWDETR